MGWWWRRRRTSASCCPGGCCRRTSSCWPASPCLTARTGELRKARRQRRPRPREVKPWAGDALSQNGSNLQCYILVISFCVHLVPYTFWWDWSCSSILSPCFQEYLSRRVHQQTILIPMILLFMLQLLLTAAKRYFSPFQCHCRSAVRRSFRIKLMHASWRGLLLAYTQ